MVKQIFLSTVIIFSIQVIAGTASSSNNITSSSPTLSNENVNKKSKIQPAPNLKKKSVTGDQKRTPQQLHEKIQITSDDLKLLKLIQEYPELINDPEISENCSRIFTDSSKIVFKKGQEKIVKTLIQTLLIVDAEDNHRTLAQIFSGTFHINNSRINGKDSFIETEWKKAIADFLKKFPDKKKSIESLDELVRNFFLRGNG